MLVFRPFGARTALSLVPILIIASVATAFAGQRAGFEGRVLDPADAPVPGARVVVAGPLGATREAVADEAGRFSFDDLPPGAYQIVVGIDGFQAEPLRLTLEAGQPAALEIRLAPLARAETLVLVAAQTEVVGSAAPGHVTTISNAELRTTQAESLADAARFAPGVTVAATGSRGGLTTAFARGGESDYTLVLLDGVRVNLFGGLFDLQQVPLAGVERVEVARGAQSALFGSDAIGGVIHIVSRQGGPFRGAFDVEGGGFGTTRSSAAASGTAGRWQLHGAAERLASDGFTGRSSDGERVSNDDYARRGVGGGARYLDRRVQLAALGRVSRNERGAPGPFGSDPNSTYQGVDRISRNVDARRTLALSATLRGAEAWQLRGQVGGARTDSDYESPFGPSSARSDRWSTRAVVDVAARAPLAWSFGAEHVRERADSTFILGADSREVPVRRATTSLFGEARLTPAPSLLVTAGVRTERIGRAALPADPLAFPPRPLLDDTAIWSTNPKLSVVYAVGGVPGGSGATTIRANLGTGIRAPDAFEVAFTDNPALAPERTRSADAGVERVWLGGRLVGEAVAFWNRYDDLIVAVGSAFANASRFRTDNISNARSRGLELAASARPHRALAVRAAYTWLDTAILAVDGAGRAPLPFEVGSPLVRRPRHQASVHAIWTTGRTSAYLRVLARGRVLDVDPSFGAFGGTLDAPGYGVADVGGQLSLGRGVAVTVRVANLFDRRYEEVLGYPSLGRHAIAGVRVALGR